VSIRFFVTIDTEEDGWGQYRTGGHTVQNISGLLKAQEIFERYGVVPTYLVTYPVASDPPAMRWLLDLRSRARIEIGTHCHPWNTPPFEESLSARNSMLSNLPYELVLRKLSVLHTKLTELLAEPPVSFRAGRWGFGPQVARAILNLGYRVDSSVTPLVDWRASCGPDYRLSTSAIARVGPGPLLEPQPGAQLLEVPATIAFLQRNIPRSIKLANLSSAAIARFLRLRGLLERTKLLNLRTFSPEGTTEGELLRLLSNAIERGDTHLNLSFHSTSLAPGNSPYVATTADVDLILRRLDFVLRAASDLGVTFLSLSEAS
jgi:hypothetical protein